MKQNNKKSKSKYLQKRNGVYYIRKRGDGKIIFRSLSTSDGLIARERASSILAAVNQRRFDVLEDSKLRKGYSTLGEVFASYLPAAAMHVKEKTAVNNVNAFRGIVASVHPTLNPDNLPANELNSDLVNKYFAQAIAKARAHGVPEDRAKRSAQSKLNQARSLFAKWTKETYKDLKLPALDPFLTSGRMKIRAVKYMLPPEDLVNRTISEGRKLKDSNPEMYAAFLLCYDLGLRSGEAIAAEWSWIRQSGGRFFMDIIRRPDFTPKGKERSIPIGATVMEHLQSLPQCASGHIIPKPTKWMRESIIGRSLATWMRVLGWDPEVYPKAAHELRKLIGSRWYTELGAEVAQSWLGHVDISTTCRYYAALTKQPAPLEID